MTPTRSSRSVKAHNLIASITPILTAFAIAIGGLITFSTDAEAQTRNPFPKRKPAPSLEGGTDWLNTSEPLALDDELKGKVVLLDFWTYCCINCIHVLPDLEYLEEKYDEELVVIGVHSAKFENEKDSEAIREAIQRYEIKHPVINDSEMRLWRKYQVSAWPTLALIDPEGYYCGYLSGEGNRDLLDKIIGQVVAYHDREGTLRRGKMKFDLEVESAARTPLRYPGKLVADEAGDRLFISDSNHHRIVITDLEGRLLDVIGSGQKGRQDGSYDEATFDQPQGMALVDDTLYVADTENHLLRTVDLSARTVSTLAGTGQQAGFRATGGRLRASALNSPWDLYHHEGRLYIAMAGPHQIWSHLLGTDRISVYAGTGREDIVDGPLMRSEFAQPSGLAGDGEYLYVCDSEGSSIRAVPFNPSQPVKTIAGTEGLPNGRSLFAFGDIDGVGEQARLQHPLGIAYLKNTLYVADSYNHKLKKITPTKEGVGRVETWLGTGEAGAGVDPVQFSEPAGLSIAGDHLFVADTNNHRILKIELATKAVSALKIEGLRPPVEAGGGK